MLDKLLSRIKPTEKIGNLEEQIATDGKRSQLAKAAYITFGDLNGGVSEPIDSKLTIGSELGELVIEEDSISPRHCTFIKNGDVICVIDHSSAKGTFLNKKKLEPGRTFIISEKDKLKIGNLNAYIEYLDVPVEVEEEFEEYEEYEEEVAEEEATPTIEDSFDKLETPELDVPEVPESNTSVTHLIQQLDEETSDGEEQTEQEEDLTRLFDDSAEGSIHEMDDPNDINSIDVEEVELDPNVLKEDEEEIEAQESHVAKRSGKKRKNGAKVKVNAKIPATNILFRFFGLSIDALLCWSIINIFYVFIDFQNFYNDTPMVVKEIFQGPYQDFLKPHVDTIINSSPALNEMVNDLVNYKGLNAVFSFVFLLFFVRLLTTMIFSVSIGQFLIGIRSEGHSLGKRLLGAIREIIGFFTAPLLIFDIPAYVGKRSFKEVITKTHLTNYSNLASFGLIIFFIPIFLLAGTLSPLLKGLEVLPSVKIVDNNLRVKPWNYSNKVYSQMLDIHYELSGHITTLPSFQIELKNKKRYLTLGLLFLDKENGNSFELKKTKEFSMFSIYKDFVKFNLFSEQFFPHIEAHVKDVSNNSSNFKKKNKKSLELLSETERIFKDTFGLSHKTMNDFIINNGPSVAGHRDFREKIENLVVDKIRKISMINFGKKRGALMEHIIGKKQYYSYFPLDSEQGQLYQVSEDISDKTYRLIADHIQFGKSSKGTVGKDPIAEFAYGFKLDPAFENFELAQAVYERYFEITGEFMRNNNNRALMQIQRNIRNLLQVLKENKLKNVKLMLNLTELLEAIKKQDDEFFNIKKTITV